MIACMEVLVAVVLVAFYLPLFCMAARYFEVWRREGRSALEARQ